MIMKHFMVWIYITTALKILAIKLQHDLYTFEKENYRYLFTMKRVIPLSSWYNLRLWLILLLFINATV